MKLEQIIGHDERNAAVDALNDLEQINKEIDRIANQLNKRLNRLKSAYVKTGEESFVLGAYSLEKAAYSTGGICANATNQTAKQFSRSKSPSIAEGKKRLKKLLEVEAKKSTSITRIKQSNQKRYDTFNQRLRKITGDSSLELSQEEYNEMIDALNRLDTNSYDSEQVLTIVGENRQNGEFMTADDILQLINNLGDRIPEMAL